MQFPQVPISFQVHEGRVTPILHSIGVILCILGLLLGAFSPLLASESTAFTIIAAALGGYAAVTSGWTTYVRAKHGDGNVGTPTP